MAAFPKPRGFMDYGLFALMLTGLLLFLFWLNGGLGWIDAAVAIIAAALCVLGTVLVRRKEQAAWISHPSRQMTLLLILAVCLFALGVQCADSYLLHHRPITVNDVVPDIVVAGAVVLSSLRRGTKAHR